MKSQLAPPGRLRFPSLIAIIALVVSLAVGVFWSLAFVGVLAVCTLFGIASRLRRCIHREKIA